MSTDVTVPKNFQERVFERIKSELGDLMTQEEIKKLVDAAMHEAFFKKEEVRTGYYKDQISYKPPQLVTLIEDMLKDQVKAAATQWVKEHTDEFKKILNDAVIAGALHTFQDWMRGVVISGTSAMAESIRIELRNKGIQI